MKLGLICRYLPPRTDGVGDYTFQLAAALARTGVDVHLVTSVGQTISAPPGIRMRLHAVVANWSALGMRRLAAWLGREAFDVVNFQYVPHLYSRRGLSPAGATLPLKIRAVSKVTVITTCHELLGHRPRGLKSRLLEIAYRIQAALLMAGSDRIVVPVVWQEKRLLHYFSSARQKVIRIPVGASILPAAGQPGRNTVPQISPEKILLGTFGTGHHWWQYEMALEILGGLRRRGVNARLLFLGDIQGTNPAYYKHLRRLETSLELQPWTEWTGRLPEEELSKRLSTVDLFLALQRAGVTARSTALISALAHGRAILATDGPDADPWLIDSGAMQIVHPLDTAAAIEAAYALILHPGECQTLQRRAAELFRNSFSWEKISDQFLALFWNLTRDRCASSS